jgi:hypothetical protein
VAEHQPPPRVRVGDAERERTAAALGEHFAAGRLTRGELDERLTAAWTARTAEDLDRLMADLPNATHFGDSPGVPAAVGRRGAGERTSLSRAALAAHAAGVVPVLALLWGIWAVTGFGFPWPVFPTVGVLAGLGGHSRGLRLCGARTGRSPLPRR